MLVDPETRKSVGPVPQAPRAVEPPRRIDSAALLGPGGEVHIVHQQQVYRLRVTSLGKLILTK